MRPDAEVSDRPKAGTPRAVVDGDVIRAVFAAFARRDIEAALALVDEDVEFWPQGTAQYAGRELPYRGHEGLRRYFEDVAAVWEHLEIEPRSVRAVSGGSTAFGVARGRTYSGDRVEVPVIWVFRLRAGRVLQAKAIPSGVATEPRA